MDGIPRCHVYILHHITASRESKSDTQDDDDDDDDDGGGDDY